MKWQDTWEPEERMMGICAPLINEFWKEYYHRTQSANLQQQQQQQQQQSLETPRNDTKQLQHNTQINLQNQHFSQQTTTNLNPTTLNHQTVSASLTSEGVSSPNANGAALNQIQNIVSSPPQQQHQQNQQKQQQQQQQEQQQNNIPQPSPDTQQQVFESVSQVV